MNIDEGQIQNLKFYIGTLDFHEGLDKKVERILSLTQLGESKLIIDLKDHNIYF